MDRKICLDSDILIEILRTNQDVKDQLSELNSNLYTTPINIFEVWGGRSKKDEEGVKKLINSLKKIDLDELSALKAGDMQIELKNSGELIDFRDLFIGAVCIQNNIELLTNNKKHFERLKKFGLKLV